MELGYLSEDIVYTIALGLLSGIGPQTQRQLVLSFPTFHALFQAEQRDLAKILPSTLTPAFYQSLHEEAHEWKSAEGKAQALLDQHIQANIVPIPISSLCYPPLLRTIANPPVILYAKGHIPLLRQTNTIALVGTREPTPSGKNVAHFLASHFAERGYCVVSGLAKGIDAAAHEGVLDVHGKTIAVFGTPLDQVYPAKHKQLAERILEEEGLLVSELSLGQRAYRSAFVQRDRIQSGLSLAVIPVQTTLDGGTMHTVSFAKAQQRLIACPLPLSSEKGANQYEGIYALLQDTYPHVYSFQASSVGQSDLPSRLQQMKDALLMTQKQEECDRAILHESSLEDEGASRFSEDKGSHPTVELLPRDRSAVQTDGCQGDDMEAVSPTVTKTPPRGGEASLTALLVADETVSSSPKRVRPRSRAKKQGAKNLSQPLLPDALPLESSDVLATPPTESKVAESRAAYRTDCVQASLW
jgi:DNA processing protein